MPTLWRRLADFEAVFKSNEIRQEDNSGTASDTNNDSTATDSDRESRAQQPAQTMKSRALWEDCPELASAHKKHTSKLARAYEKIAGCELLVSQARDAWDWGVQVSRAATSSTTAIPTTTKA